MRAARCGWISRSRTTLMVSLLGCTLGLCTPARATQKYGALELSGNLETQNLVRHSEIDKYQFIQNRNTIRIRVDYQWFEAGKFINRFDIPFIERSKLFLLYRGVYDGFYDMNPGDRQHGQTRFDDLIGGPIDTFSDSARDGLKFENRLREAYIDFKLKDAPLSFRLGRQQVIWGESDQFRIMDIWNPLDVTWHFQQESWDNIRVPLWLGKALWDIGQIGPLSNSFLELVYNPGDFQPGIKAGFLPQPWALPFANPLRGGQINLSAGNCPPGATTEAECLGHPDVSSPDFPARGTYVTPVFDLQGTSFKNGDFHRNPQDASEVGTRFHFVTPQGVEMSANYLYGRGRGVGAASPFGLKIESINLRDSPVILANEAPVGFYQVDANDPNSVVTVIPVDIKAKVVHPYMHIFGLTGNYFEGDFTNTVLRWETAYAMGEPFQTVDPNRLPAVTIQGKAGRYKFVQAGTNLPCDGTTRCQFVGNAQGFSPLGFEKRDVWTGMIGFDRPTWIRFLNPRATWFLSGQLFWNYTTGGHVDQLRGSSGAGEYPYFGPTGKWVASDPSDPTRKTDPKLVGRTDRVQISGPLASPGNGDDVRRWEHLITVAATSFYRGGTVVPFIANAWDPVNDNNETLWNVDFFYTNNFIISLQQKFFFTYGSKAPSNDPWFAGGRFSRRDESGVKLTYQF